MGASGIDSLKVTAAIENGRLIFRYGSVPPCTGKIRGIACVRLSGDCTFCGLCVERCPAGALRIRSGNGTLALVFLQENCTSCGMCISACPEAALRLAEGHSGAECEIAICALEPCPVCGIGFLPQPMYRKISEKLGGDVDYVKLCISCRISENKTN
ncbi:MAG TPA: 4Fe-4S binding protein [Candidatus Methanoperedenaceae archaeon]|nr:4Fe-4S binding protein [Candidatus Methanoperedenaceae archaeon]